jgi:hypothetical protein
MFNKVTKYYDDAGAAGNGTGGTPVNIPLGQQGNADDFWSRSANGSGSNPPKPDLTPTTGASAVTEEVKKEVAELEGLLNKETLTEAEKVRANELKTKHASILDIKEVDETGKPLTEEEKKAQKEKEDRIKAIQAKPEGQRTLDEVKFLKDNVIVQKSIYEQVDELRGEAIPVNYEGTDPNSPEGILKREETIADLAVDAYDEQLQKNYPMGYDFLKHLQAGGKPEDFFKVAKQDFLSIQLSKTDVSTQESVYRTALGLKGLTPVQIEWEALKYTLNTLYNLIQNHIDQLY